jgi:hypothetical protein
MIRLRTSLLLLAIAALLLAGAPAFAATPGPEQIAAPAAVPGLSANQCAASNAPTPSFRSIIIPPGYIQCTCKFCKEHQDVVCQISPSGYSILCEDWYQTHC